MLHSLNPKAMWHTAELMWEIMRGESRLTTAQREMELTEPNTRCWRYAEKLTLTPSAVTEADIEKLRGVGWTDRDILDIVQMILT
jgi:uncharacterized protein YciW